MRIPNDNPFPGIVPPVGERNRTPSLTSAHVSDPELHVSERAPLTTTPKAVLRLGEKGDKFPLMTASVTDLRRRTTELLDEVKRGEDVEIQQHGKTIARLVPESKPSKTDSRNFGEVFGTLIDGRPSGPSTDEDQEDIILSDRKRRLSP